MADDLTRDILRAELRAGLAEQTNALNRSMDRRFEPVTEHISRIDRGDFTPAQRAAILAVVRDDDDAKLERRSWKAPVFAVMLAAFSLVVTGFTTVGQVFFHGHG